MNRMTNRRGSSSINTISLTEAYSRAYANAERCLPTDEPAPVHKPLKPIELDYPHISTSPEYAAAAEKLNRYVQQRDAAAEKLEKLRTEAAQQNTPLDHTEEGLIAKADRLLAGESERDMSAEIAATARLIESLRDAIEAQHIAVSRVKRQLSQIAGRRYASEHKERVKRIIAAVVELHEANQAELKLHTDLNRLGYTEGALPAMYLQSVEDPHDKNGNITHYWHREAANYVKTEAEIASGVRKARLTAVLQNSDNRAAAVDNPASNQ